MKLTKKHCGLNPHIHLTPTWISNGHFALRKVTVDNLALFANEATVLATLGQSAHFTERDTDQVFQSRIDAERLPWTVTDFLYEYGRTVCRVVQSRAGVIALLDRNYCDLLSIVPGNTIYTGTLNGLDPFVSGDKHDDLTWILMSVRGGSECRTALDALTAAPVPLAQAV